MKKPLVDLEQATDEELMLAYQSGQEESFQILYRRHSKRVYGFLLGKLKTRQRVDEAFQMTFLKLHQSRHQYDPRLPFLPWLFTLCRNAMIDLLRSQNRILRQEESNSEVIENAPARSNEEGVMFLDAGPLAEVPGLDSLSENQRKAIHLRYVEDLPFEEIAKRLETSPLNARQVISRAIRSLRVWAGAQKRGES